MNWLADIQSGFETLKTAMENDLSPVPQKSKSVSKPGSNLASPQPSNTNLRDSSYSSPVHDLQQSSEKPRPNQSVRSPSTPPLSNSRQNASPPTQPTNSALTNSMGYFFDFFDETPSPLANNTPKSSLPTSPTTAPKPNSPLAQSQEASRQPAPVVSNNSNGRANGPSHAPIRPNLANPNPISPPNEKVVASVNPPQQSPKVSQAEALPSSNLPEPKPSPTTAPIESQPSTPLNETSSVIAQKNASGEPVEKELNPTDATPSKDNNASSEMPPSTQKENGGAVNVAVIEPEKPQEKSAGIEPPEVIREPVRVELQPTLPAVEPRTNPSPTPTPQSTLPEVSVKESSVATESLPTALALPPQSSSPSTPIIDATPNLPEPSNETNATPTPLRAETRPNEQPLVASVSISEKQEDEVSLKSAATEPSSQPANISNATHMPVETLATTPIVSNIQPSPTSVANNSSVNSNQPTPSNYFSIQQQPQPSPSIGNPSPLAASSSNPTPHQPSPQPETQSTLRNSDSTANLLRNNSESSPNVNSSPTSLANSANLSNSNANLNNNPAMKIQSLQQQLTAAKKILEGKDKQISALTAQLSSNATTSNTNASNKPNEAKMNEIQKEWSEKYSKLELNFQIATKEKEQFKRSLAQLQSQVPNLDSEMKALREEMKKKESIIQQLRDEGTSLAQQTVTHQNETQKIRSEKADLLQQIKDLKATVKTKQDDFDRVSRELLSSKEQYDRTQVALDEIKNASRESQNTIDDLSVYKKEHTDQIKELKTQLNKSWQDSANYQKEIQRLLENHKLELASQALRLKQEHESKMDFQNQVHNRIVDELKLTISSLRSNLANGENLVGIKEETHHAQIEQLLEKNFRLEQELLSMKEAKSESSGQGLKQVFELENDLLVHQKKFSLLEKDLRKQIADLMNEKALLHKEVDGLNTENIELQVVAKECKSLSREHQRQLAILKKKIDDLTEDKAKAEVQFSQSASKIESLEETVSALKKSIADNELLLQRKTDSVANLMRTCDKLKIELEQRNTQVAILSANGMNPQGTNGSSNVINQSGGISRSVNSSSESLKRSAGDGLTLSSGQPSQPSPFDADLPEPSLAADIDLKTLSHQKALQILEQQRGELLSLRSLIDGMKQSKTSLEQEVIQLATKIEFDRELINTCQGQKKDYDELKAVHTASLILIGEREEQVELLSNDLAELKILYKQHINALSLDIDKLLAERKADVALQQST